MSDNAEKIAPALGTAPTSGTRWAWLVAAALTVPLLILPVQAAADEWRAPSLTPQRFGFRGVSSVWEDPVVMAALGNSLAVAAMAVIVAVPVAWFAARAAMNSALAATSRSRLLVLLMLPLLLPPLAVGEGLRQAFLTVGFSFSLAGIAASHLVYVIPYALLMLAPAFTEDLRQLEEAASGLGSDRRWRFRTVTLPAVWPNLVLAAAMGFVVSWSQYGTTLGVGGGIPTLPTVMLPFVRSDPQIAATLALVFLAPALAVVGLAFTRLRR